MKRLKNNSLSATARAPFAPATRLDHVPVVFYEILHLATRGLEGSAMAACADIVPLIQSVITVTQVEADSLTRLHETAATDAA